MICPKCGSDNVSIQAVANVHTKNKGCLYWGLIGWWLEPIIWIFAFIPMLFVKLFGKSKVKTTVQSHAVCQNCGNRWKV